MEIMLLSIAVMLSLVLAITLIGLSLVWLVYAIKQASDNLSHDLLDLDFTHDD